MPGKRRREVSDEGSVDTAYDGPTPSDTESNTDLERQRSNAAPRRKRMRVKHSSPLSSPATPKTPLSPSAGVGSPPCTPSESSVSVFGTLNPLILQILDKVPRIENLKLETAAARMRGPVRLFLKTLGREPDEDGSRSCKITIKPDLVNDSQDIFNIKDFVIHKDTIRDLQRSASISYIEGKVAPPLFLPREKLSAGEESAAHYVAVSGDVLSVFNNSFRTLQNSNNTYLCVSIPGINFMYSPADKRAFVKQGRIQTAETRATMRSIWRHVLLVMKSRSVSVPVLCAIGCGAFKGKYSGVAEMWASTLLDEVQAMCGGAVRKGGRKKGRDTAPFEAIVISLPTFAKVDNHTPFLHVLQERHTDTMMPIVLSKTHSMVAIASALSESGISSGILNPSDPLAVRCGKMGMFWDGGHIALEELLALQTTLLLQHVGLNASLWEDPLRHYVLTSEGQFVNTAEQQSEQEDDENLEETEVAPERTPIQRR